MKIAVIGTGIAGNVAAYHLHKQHDIKVFEAADYIGGHTHTHDIELANESLKIDTGFIVFNKKTYPCFVDLLEEIGVDYQKSEMSFSVQCESSGLEYNGSTLNKLFAQRANLFRPGFYRMIKDILRFNRQSTELLDDRDNDVSLGEYLVSNGYSAEFIHHYIVPMGAAIWSTDHDSMFDFPASFFVRFFHNHGMLSVDDRPQWYVIKGGSKNYLEPLTRGYRKKIHLSSHVERIRRTKERVYVKVKGRDEESFDYAFIGCHSDQALAMLERPTPTEKAVLGAIPYTTNEAVLHTDQSLMPDRKLAWAAWNYHLLKDRLDKVALTYNMNMLQSLESRNTFCVTLNHAAAINPAKIIKQLSYSHPLFTREGIRAQARHREINGSNRLYYCGAYWRYGFHEDGVVSALNAVRDFNRDLQNEEQSLLRESTA